MQIINVPITNYLVLFIKAELQFIKAGTKTNVLVVSRIHSPQSKITPQKLIQPARKEKQLHSPPQYLFSRKILLIQGQG